MPYPRRLLNAGEQVVVDVRPAGWTLLAPVAVAVLAVALAAVAAAVRVPEVVGWLLVGLLTLTLARLVVRYLQWRSTSLVVTTERLVRRTGVLSRRAHEMPLSQLTDVACRRSVVERLVGTGDLVVESAGHDGGEVIAGLPHPAAIQNRILALVPNRRDAGHGGPLTMPEQLEKLAELRERGVLSDAEFAATKARLLHGT